MNKFAACAVLTVGLLISPLFTQAASLTSSQVQAILSLLTSFGADSATIANVQTSLMGGTPTGNTQSYCHDFNSDMTVGKSGDDVAALNKVLSLSNIDTTGNTATFDENNAGDVVAFQAHYGIRQTGYVGPMTRAKLNALYGCHGQQPMPTPTPTPVAQVLTPTTQAFSVLYPTAGMTLVQGQATTIAWTATSGNATYVVGSAGMGGNIGTYTSAQAHCEAASKCYVSWTPTYPSSSFAIGVYDMTTGQSGVSGMFAISPSSTTGQLTPASATLVNTQSSYAGGQTIRFSVMGIASDGSYGTPDKGFNVQAYMSDGPDATYSNTVVNGVSQGVNAVYNTTTNLWDVTLTAPNDNSTLRTIQASFYCSSTSGSCARNKGPGTAGGQIDRYFNFNVTGASTLGSLSFSPSAYTATYVQGTPLPSTSSNSPNVYTNTPFLINGTFTNTSTVPVTYSISVPSQPAWLNTSYSRSSSTLPPGQSSGLGAYLDPATVAMIPGTYRTNIIMTGNFVGSPMSIPVTLNVVAAPLTIATDPPQASLNVSGDTTQIVNGILNVYNVTNPTVTWSSTNATYCKATSVELTTQTPTNDFTGTLAPQGSRQLLFGNSYYNQREITLTCYRSDGTPTPTLYTIIAGKG